MKKLFCIGLAVCMVCLIAFSGCGKQSDLPAGSPSAQAAGENGGGVIVAKFAHALSPQSPYQTGAEKFKELVEEKTGGKVVIKIYPNGQLGAERDLFEGLKLGTVEFAVGGMGVLSQAYEPKLEVFGLPFMFESREEVYEVLDGPVGQELYKPLLENQIEIVGNFEAGFRQLSNSKRPVNSINDVKGLKIRTPEGSVYINTWNALGASPTPIAWNELYSALQTGVVDGAEVPISNFATSGFGEVQKYYGWINYMYDSIPFGASKSFMDSLSPELQEAVREAAKEACDFERQTVKEMEAQLQAELEGQGVQFTTPDLEPFRAAVQPIYDNYADKETLGKVQAALGRQ